MIAAVTSMTLDNQLQRQVVEFSGSSITYLRVVLAFRRAELLARITQCRTLAAASAETGDTAREQAQLRYIATDQAELEEIDLARLEINAMRPIRFRSST